MCCDECDADDWCCDCCRVLEQSYMAEDTKLGTKRKHADLWFVDPLNPYERKRIGRRPVGLKNVGNTCWFSAVVQVGCHNAGNFYISNWSYIATHHLPLLVLVGATSLKKPRSIIKSYFLFCALGLCCGLSTGCPHFWYIQYQYFLLLFFSKVVI